MNQSIILMLLLQVVLILLNAFFACAEIALISVNENKLEKLAEQGNKRAARLVKMNQQPASFLATIQVAITLSGFLASAFAADNFAEPLVTWLQSMGVTIPEHVLHSATVVIITLILSYFTLVFGELVPKQIAMRKAETLSLSISGTIHVLSKIFAPIVWTLTISTNLVLRLLRIESTPDNNDVSEEEIRMMVDIGSEKGTIATEEREVIQNVFEFDDLMAVDLYTHRTDVVLLNMEDSLSDWEKTMFESRHTLYPVCQGSPDHIIGILNIKDYFQLKARTKDIVTTSILTPAYFVPDTIKANVLFSNMKSMHQMLSLVIDEYGCLSGIVTMNDLVEEIVGEIVNDTVTDEVLQIQDLGNNSWVIRGNASLSDISKTIHVDLEDDNYNTLTGLIYHRLGKIPKDGELIELTIDNLEIKVTSILKHRAETTFINIINPEL